MLPDLIAKIRITVSRWWVRGVYWYEYAADYVWEWRMQRLHTLNQQTFIVLFVAIGLLAWAYFGGIAAPALEEEKLVTIEEGAPLVEIADMLEEEGIVRSSWWLVQIVRLRGGEESVYAGDYLFRAPHNAISVSRTITTGAFGLEPVRITVPEGATVSDMAIIFDRRLYKFDPNAFLEEALPLEGYLFPDTYHFLPNATHEQVIGAMSDAFDTHIEQYLGAVEASPYTLHEILTLASIIEKEASNARDRQLISGVLHNRLDIGMKLQVDATFTYTHNKGTYQITLDELLDESNLYNTYVHDGLPPGPIAAPGESSIYAALNPIENDYLFYLADRSGRTYYSKTYEQHLIKKNLYID